MLATIALSISLLLSPRVDKGPWLRVYSFPRIILAQGGAAPVTIHARIEGGMNEKWYCPMVRFTFPDGTEMKRESDCTPFEEREDDGPTHWEAMRWFGEGEGDVIVDLIKRGKAFASQRLTITVH